MKVSIDFHPVFFFQNPGGEEPASLGVNPRHTVDGSEILHTLIW